MNVLPYATSRRAGRRRRPDGLGRSGMAALEMGLCAPVLVAFIAGVSDCSFVYHEKLQLAAVLTAGAEYAFNKGQSETGSTLVNDVTAFVTAASPITLSTVSATYYGGATSTSYYCVSTTGVFTGGYTKGQACTDDSGAVAGQFISISGTFSYAAIFPADTTFMPTTFPQTVIVRLN